MLNVGDYIKVKTQTKDDVFGECVYKVVKTGLKCPECKGDDAIHFVMIGGTGPSACAGRTIVDCPQKIGREMQKGITVVLSPAQAAAFEKMYASGGKTVFRANREIEME